MSSSVAATNSQELLLVLRTLFLEQQAGLRDPRKNPRYGRLYSINNQMKAILLRHQVYRHLSASMPEFALVVDQYLTQGAYLEAFGVSVNGVRVSGKAPASDSESEEDATRQPVDSAQGNAASSYKSKGPLMDMLRNLLKNKWERTFMAMAKELGDQPGLGSMQNELNLALVSASAMKKIVSETIAMYVEDFPPTPVISSTAVLFHKTQADAGNPLQVRMQEDALDEASYIKVLSEWTDQAFLCSSSKILPSFFLASNRCSPS
jgi:hypothetical protein